MRLFTGIASTGVSRWRARVAPMIERALVYSDGGFNADDVLDRCEKRDAQLWAGFPEDCSTDDPPECVVVTEILTKPRLKVARLWVAAGENLPLWLPIGQPILDRWARIEGAAEMQLHGRLGWTRRTPGWRIDEVVMRRDLV